MPKMPNHRFRGDLPRKVLDQLDPKLAELYSLLSPSLSSQIASLVNDAMFLGIHPNRLVKYAFLWATAENQARGDAVSKDHAARARHELAGAIHGRQTGYRDQAETKQRYRRGRRAREQMRASLEGLLRKWQMFEAVVRKHGSELPEHLQSRFSNATLRNLGRAFQSMGIALVLDEPDLVSEEGRARELSAIAQTYIWWRLAMADYRDKWNDMHRLAFTWRMSPTESAKRFRTVVGRICKGAGYTYRLDESWKSTLSEE